jgi:hypothetical protein
MIIIITIISGHEFKRGTVAGDQWKGQCKRRESWDERGPSTSHTHSRWHRHPINTV